MTGEYDNFRRVTYNCKDDGNALFIPVCPGCGRFVKADDTVRYSPDVGIKEESNATCTKCGRVEMPFEGFFSDEELEDGEQC